MAFKLQIMKIRVTFVSLALLALLLASGGLLPASATSSSGSSSSATSYQSLATNVPPASVLTATKMGTTPTLAAVAASQANIAGVAKAESNVPTSKLSAGPNVLAAASAAFVPPVVSASNIVNNGGGASSAKGLNAYDNGGVTGGLDLEPPDQGLCAGNGYAIDVLNLVLKVYSASTFAPLSSDVSLPALIGFPVDQVFGSAPIGGGYILSDPRCLYDSGTGHWFLSFLYLGGAGVYSASGPFPLGPNTFGAEFVLARYRRPLLSVSWNVYGINVTDDGGIGQTKDTGCPCFGDQPLLGADQNALVISTNEYPVFPLGFNGGQVYLFDKLGLANGFLSVNVAHFQTGLIPSPDGACQPLTGLDCWWTINPANSPTPGSYDTSQKGTEWAMSVLDFANNAFGSSTGDNRMAIWSFSDTASLHSLAPNPVLNVKVALHLNKYYDPELDPKTGAASGYLVPQKIGPHPLGVDVYSNNATIACAAKCPVGKLASNGDGMWNTVVYAQGSLWGVISSLVNEGTKSDRDVVLGAAFYIFDASGSSVKSRKSRILCRSECRHHLSIFWCGALRKWSSHVHPDRQDQFSEHGLHLDKQDLLKCWQYFRIRRGSVSDRRIL